MKAKSIIFITFFTLLFGLIFFSLGSRHPAKDEEVLSAQSSVSATIKKEIGKDASRGLFFSENRIATRIKDGGKLTFLLLGYGGENHAGAYLTDTIIIAQLDFSRNKLLLINIPRDLWINGRKINSYYSDRKDAAEVVQILEDNLQITIDDWVTADFDGFRKLIDKLGGVEIYVEKSFDDYNYPRNDSDWIDPGIIHLHFEQGWQLMDGETALQYSRSRYSSVDGGDFNRSRRQQQVLVAVKDELLKAENILRSIGLIKIAQENAKTSLSFKEIWSLTDYFVAHQDLNIENKIISADNYLYETHTTDGAYILLPKNGNFDEIGKLMSRQ